MARKFVAVDLKERPWGKINPTFGLVGEKWNNDISSPSLSDGLNYFMINNKHPFIFEKNEKFFDVISLREYLQTCVVRNLEELLSI